MNKIKESIKLLTRYFENKRSEGMLLLNDECVLTAFDLVMKNKPTCQVYQNKHENYMIGILSPVFSTRREAEAWAIENGFKLMG